MQAETTVRFPVDPELHRLLESAVGGAQLGEGSRATRQATDWQIKDGEKMPEWRSRVTTGGRRALFQIDVDGGHGFRPPQPRRSILRYASGSSSEPRTNPPAFER